MRNSTAAQPSTPSSAPVMSGSGPAYVAPASSTPVGGGYTYPAPASSGGSAGYARIPTYPAPPSSYPATNPPTPQVSTNAPVQDPTAPPSPLAKAGELVARLREQGQALMAARRPWAEVFRAAAFSRPPSLGEALARTRRNAAYFRANYALAVLAAVAASLLWHPGTLLALVLLCAAWFFLYFARARVNQPLRVLGTEFDDGTVLAALCGVTVVALLFTSVGWNVVGSVMVGGALVGAHAALRTTDDLFLTEQEAAGDGLVAAGPILPTYVRIV
ncbi:prenylated Rab receptor 2 [Zea mays]|jgi:PRA1 family protein 1|uniref:PRA1 family protein n=1 Tax=Zea mays TaxID=4577 RepID=A0A1D6GHY1_MAIZE|nr:prenylated Rab receptor 2 [Zea mays]AQK63061.1 PRA1 family protein G2 [Zea mays]|eukprot:NP_001150167.2 prenylated Rab receptor 2 [Zea mays]